MVVLSAAAIACIVLVQDTDLSGCTFIENPTYALQYVSRWIWEISAMCSVWGNTALAWNTSSSSFEGLSTKKWSRSANIRCISSQLLWGVYATYVWAAGDNESLNTSWPGIKLHSDSLPKTPIFLLQRNDLALKKLSFHLQYPDRTALSFPTA